MALYIDIRCKNGTFDGAPKRWNMVVKGTENAFKPAMTQLLDIWGFRNLSRPEEGRCVWSTTYEVGGPLIFLANFIAKTHGGVLTKDAKDYLDQATSAHVPDGFQRFIGNAPKPATRGDDALFVSHANGMFLANCSSTNPARIAALQKAGWIPLPAAKNVPGFILGDAAHYTTIPMLALPFSSFMLLPCKEQLALGMKAFSKQVKRSSMVSLPEGETADIPVPEGKTLTPYQQICIKDIAASGEGTLIADDMGIGKTIEAIGISNLRSRPEVVPALIISKAVAKINWEDEWRQWSVHQDVSIGIASGDFFPETDVVIINYDILDRHAEKIFARQWSVVIVDESQNALNEGTLRTSVVRGDDKDLARRPGIPLRKATKDARKGIMLDLTGSPIPKEVADSWAIISTSMQRMFGRGRENKIIFSNLFCPPIVFQIDAKSKFNADETYKRTVFKPGKEARPLLFNLIMRGMGMYRRLKTDIPGFPKKTRYKIKVGINLSEEDQRALARNEDALRDILNRSEHVNVTVTEKTDAGAIIDLLDQIPAKSPTFFEIAAIRHAIGLIKAPYLAQAIIEDTLEEGRAKGLKGRPVKSVTFAHHKDVVDIYVREYEKIVGKGNVLRIDGTITSDKKRQEMKRKFQNDPKGKYPFMVISMSGTTSVTLTAASKLFAAELVYSAEAMSQMEDRICRFGQTETSHIGYGVIPGSLDDHLCQSIFDKMFTQDVSLNAPRFTNGLRADKKPKARVEAAPAEPARPRPEDDGQMEMAF